MSETSPVPARIGHGHVNPRPDGSKARCGGPAICADCARERAETQVDVHARIGVRLFRWSTGDFRRDPESIDGEHDSRYQAFEDTPEAVAEIERIIAYAIWAWQGTTPENALAEQAAAVRKALGFTDA